MKKLIYTFLIAFTCSFTNLSAQSPVIRIDTLIRLSDDSISIPVYFSNFSNIGSVTLYISHNPYILRWGKGINWLTEFNNGFNFANGVNGTIAITCVNYNGVTMTEGKLLDLRMKYYGGISGINFLAGCEITDINGIPITPQPVFINGAIASPLNLSVTADKNPVCPGDTCKLYCVPTGLFGNYSFQWSSDPAGHNSTDQYPDFQVFQTTRFFVTVSSGENSDTASITINADSLPLPEQVVILQPQTNSTGLINPVTFSWQPALYAETYDLYLWLEGSSMPVFPVLKDQGNINYSFPNGLSEGKSYLWKVNSKNTCLETEGIVNQFTMLPLPDLHVSHLETSQPAAGQMMQVSWTVVNNGEGPTTIPTWIDHVWLSVDLDLGSNRSEDILLGQYPNISALNPGESYTQTKNIVLPENIYGNYFVFVVTDALDARDIEFFGPPPVPYTPPPYLVASTGDMGVVRELDEDYNFKKHDNFNYQAIFLTVPPVPDLIATNIIQPANTFSGQLIPVTYTVMNQGEISALQSSWIDRIYISSDTLFDLSTALPLTTITHGGGLPLDSSYTENVWVKVPPEFSGKYFVYVVVDANQAVFEYVFDGNNILRSDTLTVYLTPPADLTVSGIIVPESASARGSKPFEYTVVNQGGSAPLVNTWRDRVYFSTSPDYDLSEAIESRFFFNPNQSFFPGASYSKTDQLSIPGDITGDWYIYVHTDVDDDVFEYTMNDNNLVRSDYPVHILNPDLIIDPYSIPANDFSDQPLPVQWQTRNQGPGDLVYSRWTENLQLSPDASYNPLTVYNLGSRERTKSIPNNDTQNWNDTIILPDCNTGYYYMYINTDAANTIYEPGNESNNITRSNSSIHIQRADLSVTGLEAPSDAESGEPLFVRATIFNLGEGTIINKHITNRITVSLTPQANPLTDRIIMQSVRSCNLAPGDSIVYNDTLYLPPDLTGQWYLSYTTNINRSVKEGDARTNNTFTSSQTLLIATGPMPDLQFQSVTLPDTLYAGIPIMTHITINNAGQKGIYGNPWTDKLYYLNISAWTPELATTIGQWEKSPPLAKDEFYQIDGGIVFPQNLPEGTYYFFAETDAGSTVYEAGGESNNLSGPYEVYIRSYPVDVAVTEAIIPNDTVGSGSKIKITYRLQNFSTQYMDVSGTWTDGAYLSTDPVWDPESDIKIDHWTLSATLSPNSYYYNIKEVQIPGGITGEYYLLVVYDIMQLNPDTDRFNDRKIASEAGFPAQTVNIQILPSPDFNITELNNPAQVLAGHEYSIYWTVSNDGPVATDSAWFDKIYLSADALIGYGDVLLGSAEHHEALLPGSSYSDSLQITASTTLSGNYYLIIKTDATDEYYEHQNENNNVKTQLIFFREAPPSDLVPGPPITAAQGYFGENHSVSWSLVNDGNNDLFGPLKDAIYLSADSVYSQDDYRWFTFQDNIYLAPGEVIERDTIVPFPAITPGNYYLLIRTDITNIFQETDESNNIAAGGITFISIPQIFLDQPVSSTLENLQQIYYKLEIPDSLAGESLVLSLKGDSINGFNEIYAALNYIPDRINFDYQYAYTLQGNQDLIIPELSPGTYYFMITGSTLPNQQQDLLIEAHILEFEIRKIDADKGGVLGHITVLITGSKFEPGMEIYLLRDSIIIPALIIDYVNSTSLFATFQLFTTGYGLSHWEDFPVPKGFYDVLAVKNNNETAILSEGFEVVDFQTPEFLVSLDYPARVRSMNVFIMTISFTNTGNINLPVPKRILNSETGAPLAFDSQSLSFNQTYLDLVFKEPGGPEDILRPGAVCSLKIYCRAMFVQSMHNAEETRIQYFRLLEE
ncbi:MAG: CARDB domain-containing protein [Bacteroidales bacterium]